MMERGSMNSVQKQLIMCMAAYRQGASSAQLVEDLSGDDWQKLYMLAAEQKMGPMVFETLWKNPAFCKGHPALWTQWKQQTLLQTATQAVRSRRILEITAAFREAQIPYALVKGVLCRELYAQPDLRPSGDEDLFISALDWERSRTVLQQCGLTQVENDADADVTHWGDPQTGLHIELHIRLFSNRRPEDVRLNEMFEQQLQHTVSIPVMDGKVETFQPTYFFVFLVCHAIKHFLTGGFGIRTIADIVTFAERYQGQINVPQAEQLLEQLHGRVFLDQLFFVGQCWLGFDLAAAGWRYCSTPCADMLLQDSLEAGVYGQSSLSRKHSAELVLHAAEQTNPWKRLVAVLFPPKEKMLRKYPCLRQRPVLLPLCWLHRLGKYGIEVLRSGQNRNSPRESLLLGKQRAEMMVKYGIFPESKKKS